MRALVLENGTLRLCEIPEPEINLAAGEALVRVRRAGICRTDLELAKGYMGFEGVLGHEFVGQVEQHPDPAWIGRRVAGEINLGCGHCEFCDFELDRHCPHRRVLGIQDKHGCFAELVSLPAHNLHWIPDGVSDDSACFVEPLAAAFEILEQLPELDLERSSSPARSGAAERDRCWLGRAVPRVAVLGDGKLGQLIARVLRHQGCDLVLVGHHAQKLSLASRRGIATAPVRALAANSFDVVVEATGSTRGMQAAVHAVRPRGVLVLKSTYHGNLELDAAPLVIDEISVVGSRCGRFPRAIEALEQGAIETGDLISARLPFRSAERAFEIAGTRGQLKVLLEFPGFE